MSATASLLKEVGARISGGKNKKTFVLLYKGIDKADVEEFHSNCDAKGPTVTVLHGKFNTLFGGYTSQNWSSNKKQTKKDEHAFLFYKNDSRGSECIFLPIVKEKYERAITCDANFGPTFGGGALAWEDYDLQAFKKDKKSEYKSKDGYLKLNGTLKVPCAYNVEDNCDKNRSSPQKEDSNNKKVQSSEESSKAEVESKTDSKTDTDKDKQSSEKPHKMRVNAKDINSGSMLVECIEVYQVVDDELSVPWIEKPKDGECSRKKDELEKMEPLSGLDINHYNILLVGVIGSGKSSLYNTLATVFSGKVVNHVPTRDSTKSVTNEVNAYDLVSKHGEKLNVKIYDIRGFEDERGIDHELEALLEGKLKIGYQFRTYEKDVACICCKTERRPILLVRQIFHQQQNMRQLRFPATASDVIKHLWNELNRRVRSLHEAQHSLRELE